MKADGKLSRKNAARSHSLTFVPSPQFILWPSFRPEKLPSDRQLDDVFDVPAILEPVGDFSSGRVTFLSTSINFRLPG